jgi:phosphatidylserine/phosphatidylglycerophosphate/cardiolipin synthase-like enzyme
MQSKGKGNFKRNLLDQTFDIEKAYFFKHLSSNQWNSVKEFMTKFFDDGKSDEAAVSKFLDGYKILKKGAHNMEKLTSLLNEVSEGFKGKETAMESYRAINNVILKEYMMPKPAVLEAHFFPNEAKEDKVINMLRTVKNSLDIAIFTLTNDKIFAAIEEVWNAGVDVRIITDDECCNQLGSDIFKLAAMGVPVKTDDAKQYHMHHKFAVLDEAVVVTGSFNWTTQAVLHNQENIMFFENSQMAKAYNDEFEKMWSNFKTIISENEAKEKVEKERENRRKWK